MRRRRRIDPYSDRPVYRQVADDLRAQILDGTIPAGEMLLGEARLATEYEVGATSIRNALAVLRAERLIVTEQGVGSRVRTADHRRTVNIPQGARIRIRPATEAERRRWGLVEHEPVAVIETDDGTEVLPAYRVVLVAEGDTGPQEGPPGE